MHVSKFRQLNIYGEKETTKALFYCYVCVWEAAKTGIKNTG